MHLLAHPFTATAIVGLALITLAGSAGATTVSVSAAPAAVGIVANDASTDSVVTVDSGALSRVEAVATTVLVDPTVPAVAATDVTVDDPSGSVAAVMSTPFVVPATLLVESHRDGEGDRVVKLRRAVQVDVSTNHAADRSCHSHTGVVGSSLFSAHVSGSDAGIRVGFNDGRRSIRRVVTALLG